MIVKVQVDAGRHPPSVLVCTKDGSVHFHTPMTQALRGKLNKKPVRYFHANVEVPGSKTQGAQISKDSAHVFELGEETFPAAESAW